MKTQWLAAAAAVMLSGCAGMDQAECRSADWQMIGFEDGAAGKTQANIGEYRKDCAEHGITPDLALYQQGYAEGVRSFCSESSGFNYGRNGGAYQGVCPGEMEPDFLAGYRLGREHYILSRQVAGLKSQIRSNQSRIRSLEDSIAQKTLEVADDDTSGDKRLELMLDIKNQTLEIGELRSAIRKAEAELVTREAEYAALERPSYF